MDHSADEYQQFEELLSARFNDAEPILPLTVADPAESEVLQQLRQERLREDLAAAGNTRNRLAVWSCWIAVAGVVGAVIAMISTKLVHGDIALVLFALEGILLIASLGCAIAALAKRGASTCATDIAVLGIVLWFCAAGITFAGMSQRYAAEWRSLLFPGTAPSMRDSPSRRMP